MVHKKKIYELPYISKNNRIFEIENILVPEEFLIQGENSIYILAEILNNLNGQITADDILESFVLFEMDEENDD